MASAKTSTLTPRNYEYDCTRKCRLVHHGSQISAALTKRTISDEQLAAFIAKTCANFMDIVDDLGRSAVHLAASMSRYEILEWLLNQGAIINGRDCESGSSALHRSIYYGSVDCAVLLLRYGASPDLLDEDTRCALQNVCRPADFGKYKDVASNNEILLWGTNKNYNLGTGNSEPTNTPQSVEFFRREHISIKSVALGAYHSLFLNKSGLVYAVGHGEGGRLGNGSEHSLAAPKKVKVPIKGNGEHVIAISVSRKHSLLLTNNSTVFACGLNEDKQLGVRDVGEKLSVFREVLTLRDLKVTDLKRVIARDYHSITYSNKCVYMWGANHGQMGLDNSVKAVPMPRQLKLPLGTEIIFVEANNAATVVYTKDDNILLYFNNKMRTIKPPNFESLKSICVFGGDTSKSGKGTATALKLLMLTETNVIFFWYEMTQQFYRCSFSNIRITQIDKILYKANQVFILSDGDVYKGKCQQVPVPSYMTKSESQKHPSSAANIWSSCNQNKTEICKDHMIRIELQRYSSVDRAVDISCDEDFTSFAVLQESHYKYFKAPYLHAESYSFKKLYNDVDIFDAVHDVVFHVDSETYAAHKFIIYARAPGLGDILKSYEDKEIYLNFKLLTGKMFEIILKHIYTNQLPSEEDFDNIQHSLGPDCPTDGGDVCKLFLKYVEKFKLPNLANYLKSYLLRSPFYLPQYPDKSVCRFDRLHHGDFPELYDVRIICGNDVVIPAHKCILVARLDYFNMMFTHTWAEQSTINLSTIPPEYMQPIVEFLYSSEVEHFRKQNYSEAFLYNMIVYCDQFFIERLRKVCEIMILDKISIRRCGEMLDFACMYNCELMKRGCMDFICQNLARVLNYKSLDICDPDALKCINKHYRQMYSEVFDYRVITPDSGAVDDELLMSFVSDFHVDLNYRMDEDEDAVHKSAAKLKSRENKNNMNSKRQYELEAISSMLESINVDEKNLKSPQETQSKSTKEAADVAEKLQAEARNWMKVADKKDLKKRQTLEGSLKINEILKAEEKPIIELVPLTKMHGEATTAKTSEKPLPEDPASVTPVKGYSLNLADFTSPPSREKLSQKQRKRLSSESTQSWRAPAPTDSKPVNIPVTPPNAWGVVPQASSSAYSVSPPTGSISDPSSFANMMRAGNSNVHNSSPQTADNSFSRILADERKQRDYYERMRNKSLVLTQIEERAIAELREFYNVDNVTDEEIVIERKALAPTMNFAVWQRH
ncbi:inhibitor of Bruton tyrosine kinase [Ceratitis capitata]|uniref:inhibitor of Bruton tyrosine kinase n=1 Tax=Ceratitis capitata TaxID=7213 RepID=UPI00032A0EF6|nr:inhibitor of Bruton tyrosine kinase [Ceratitis capitata]XP_020717674.1 inhibitor of Bruton tyrosine kinase [Ceratitis capitata]